MTRRTFLLLYGLFFLLALVLIWFIGAVAETAVCINTLEHRGSAIQYSHHAVRDHCVHLHFFPISYFFRW